MNNINNTFLLYLNILIRYILIRILILYSIKYLNLEVQVYNL